jgi:hypothetical protein
METYAEQKQRIANKIASAKWPELVPVPKCPKLRLSGKDGNVFSIIARAKSAADKAKWTDDQWNAFYTLVKAGDYDHAIQTCMTYFDVS